MADLQSEFEKLHRPLGELLEKILEAKLRLLHKAQVTCKKRPGEFKCSRLGCVLSPLHTDTLITKQIINKKYQARAS